jgi:quinoprotein glucose dehydrogenase
MEHQARRWFPSLLAALLILAGIALLVLGVILISAGGAWPPAVFGIGFLAVGTLLWQRRTLALGVHALVLLLMLAWSLVEVGLDWWPLAARLDVAFVFAVLLLLPPVTRLLAGRRLHVGLLGGVAAVSLLVAIAAGVRESHDVSGELPTAAAAPQQAATIPDGDWQAYGRTAAGQRYSPLGQITPANARNLQVAWQFRTGDLRGRVGDPEETTDEVTPLKIGNRLFLCTPHQQAIALDATTGKEIWRFDAHVTIENKLGLQHLTCRGLSYQAASAATASAASSPAPAAASAPPPASASSTAVAASPDVRPIAAQVSPSRADCGAKLFMATADGRLIALDPESGAVCSRFGNGTGQVDLYAGMPNLRPGSYYSTSPPVVTRHVVIVGGTVLDNYSTHEESGVIRAFDVDTGALVWNWDSGNPDATAPIAPGATYTGNSPNSWSISSADEALGLVYVPMGNQPPDQFGGNRSAAV